MFRCLSSGGPFLYMGVCSGGGGGGDSQAKLEFFQFLPFFSKISFWKGGYVNLLEISKKRPFRKGVRHGGVGDHIFSLRAAELGHLLVNLGLHCVQGFQGARPMFQHIVPMTKKGGA